MLVTNLYFPLSRKRSSSRKSASASSVPTTPSGGPQPSTGGHTVVGYFFCGEPIPYRTTLPGKHITLGQFKQLISKKGNYRCVSEVLNSA